MIKNRAKFLRSMVELEPYLVEFEEDSIIKAKVYPENYQVGRDNCRPVICITHNECTFSANDCKTKIWQRADENTLRLKGKDQGIMVSDFLFLFGQLSLSHLSNNDQDCLLAATGLSETEVVEIFEYDKNNDGYWDRPKLLKQVISKAVLIAKALYSGYSFLFMFDNATSHAVYAEDALCTGGINKNSEGKQALIRDD